MGYYKGKESGSKFFLFRVDPISEQTKCARSQVVKCKWIYPENVTVRKIPFQNRLNVQEGKQLNVSGYTQKMSARKHRPPRTPRHKRRGQEQIITKQMPHMKPPTHKQRRTERGAALERSAYIYDYTKFASLFQSINI